MVTKTATIIVDFRHTRCGNCKVALKDELATQCPICGAMFDRVNSNHVGLAERLLRKRGTLKEGNGGQDESVAGGSNST